MSEKEIEKEKSGNSQVRSDKRPEIMILVRRCAWIELILRLIKYWNMGIPVSTQYN
jgi:hypothetical protein